MYLQRLGIVTSLAIHTGILLLLLMVPGMTLVPHFQAIQISFERQEVLSTGHKAKIIPIAATKAERQKSPIQQVIDSSPRPSKKEAPQEAAFTENHHQPFTATELSDEKPGLAAGRNTEVIAINKIDHQGTAKTEPAGDRSTETQGIVETRIGHTGAPTFIYRALPVYPIMARRLGKEGTVVLKLFIDEQGTLQNIEVIESAGFGFTEAVVEAVKKSTYSPARKNGATVASKALLPVRFHLE
jgi:periplasmic protein TonB